MLREQLASKSLLFVKVEKSRDTRRQILHHQISSPGNLTTGATRKVSQALPLRSLGSGGPSAKCHEWRHITSAPSNCLNWPRKTLSSYGKNTMQYADTDEQQMWRYVTEKSSV